MKKRIKASLEDESAMPELIYDRTIRLDVRIAYLQYDFKRFGKDVMRYKSATEGELQYDV